MSGYVYVCQYLYVCVMKQGRGSADATSPRAINQTEPAAEPVQIGLISLGMSRNQGKRTGEGGRDREKWRRMRERKIPESTLFYFYISLMVSPPRKSIQYLFLNDNDVLFHLHIFHSVSSEMCLQCGVVTGRGKIHACAHTNNSISHVHIVSTANVVKGGSGITMLYHSF